VEIPVTLDLSDNKANKVQQDPREALDTVAR
jgi:hypothetical protein